MESAQSLWESKVLSKANTLGVWHKYSHGHPLFTPDMTYLLEDQSNIPAPVQELGSDNAPWAEAPPSHFPFTN